MSSLVRHYWHSADPPISRYRVIHEVDIGLFLPAQRVYRLPTYSWHCSANYIERRHLEALANRPRHVLHHLVNERVVGQELNARGIAATLVQGNAFLDERLLSPAPGVAKCYDAVYNARMTPFKRHALAHDVSSLLLVGGVYNVDDSQHYFALLKQLLPHAHFAHDGILHQFRDAAWVTAQVNRARVGLCLSAVEGAMSASAEYLLCGLPVVSTESLGGRDELFDPALVRVVKDDPRAVAEAVRELIALNVPAAEVRERTLAKLWEHRRRFFDVVQEIYDREGVGRDFAAEWRTQFFNKMFHFTELSRLAASLRPEPCGAPA